MLSISYSLVSDTNFLRHALTNITENMRKVLDDGNIDFEMFVDFQNAFDSVDQQILLPELNPNRFRGVSNNWFKSYLYHCNQYVSISS